MLTHLFSITSFLIIFFITIFLLLIFEKFRQADFRLMHWLNAQEDIYQLLIYECDYFMTNWTRRCLRQADAILLIADGETRPRRHEIVRVKEREGRLRRVISKKFFR